MSAQTQEETYGTYRKILFCTDFSANADFAFRLAVGAAGRHEDASLTLLHVLPEAEAQFWKNYIYDVENVDEKAKADIDKRIDEVYRPQLLPGVRMEVVFRVGNPAAEIIDFASEMQPDLIVLGRAGKGLLSFGSVSAKVVKSAKCPVLIVPMDFAKKSAQ